MAAFKVTHLFDSQLTANGWSETWYITQGTLPDAQKAGALIAQARVRMLGPSFQLHYQRVSMNLPRLVANAPRRTRAASLENLGLYNKAGGGGVAGTSDVVYTSALVRLSSADLLTFRMQLFRGLPDELWSNGNDAQAKAFMGTNLPPFMAALRAGNGYILHKNGAVQQPVPLDSAQYFRMSKRDTGRPFGVSRGRR